MKHVSLRTGSEGTEHVSKHHSKSTIQETGVMLFSNEPHSFTSDSVFTRDLKVVA